MTKKTERSVEEIVEEYDGLAFTISEAKDWLRKTLQAERQKREEVVEAERERIRDIVNEEAKRSFYVGKEMWRNDAYKVFRERIFDVVFEKPHDVRPCQFECGNNIDWVISNDDGDEFQIATSVQCGHCGQLNLTQPPTPLTNDKTE